MWGVKQNPATNQPQGNQGKVCVSGNTWSSIKINKCLKSKSSASCLQKHNSLTKGLICPVKITHCHNCGAFSHGHPSALLHQPQNGSWLWPLFLMSFFLFSTVILQGRGGISLILPHTASVLREYPQSLTNKVFPKICSNCYWKLITFTKFDMEVAHELHHAALCFQKWLKTVAFGISLPSASRVWKRQSWAMGRCCRVQLQLQQGAYRGERLHRNRSRFFLLLRGTQSVFYRSSSEPSMEFHSRCNL